MELTPDMEMPMLFVLTIYQGGDPETTQELVTKVVEDSGKTLAGVDSIDSQSTANMSMVMFSYDYGTDIHERPEFLMTLGHLFPEAKKLDGVWRSKSKSYKIDFYATIDQIHRFSFELDEFKDEGQLELDDEMKIKKWMLSYAIDRAAKKLDTQFLYVKDDVIISPEQIIEISELYKL